MTIDETRLASAVLDGEEEQGGDAPAAPEASAIDGEEGGETPAAPQEDQPAGQLDGEEGDAPAEEGDTTSEPDHQGGM